MQFEHKEKIDKKQREMDKKMKDVLKEAQEAKNEWN